jgi:hypothetical protein
VISLSKQNLMNYFCLIAWWFPSSCIWSGLRSKRGCQSLVGYRLTVRLCEWSGCSCQHVWHVSIGWMENQRLFQSFAWGLLLFVFIIIHSCGYLEIN